MVIASLKIILDFYGNQNLHKKKSEMATLFKDIKKKFNVSVLETADFDDYERCVFGVTAVCVDEKSARAMGKKITDHIDGSAFARVVMEDSELFFHD